MLQFILFLPNPPVLMALNWVSRTSNPPGFVLLPEEVHRFALPQEVAADLNPIGQQNGDTITIKGNVSLTSHRVVILSTRNTQQHDNFSLLYKDIVWFKLEMPWLGSNKFRVTFRVSDGNGGLNYMYQWSLCISFVEGGAIQFAKEFEQLKTRFDNSQVDELPPYTEQM